MGATIEERIKAIEKEIFLTHSFTNLNLLVRRLEKAESFTEYDLENQPILIAYQNILSKIEKRDFKIIQDVKLIKLYSLTYNLVWYNNALERYIGNEINFEPLISLMNKKNRYFNLNLLKLYQIQLEYGKDLESLFKQVVHHTYNSIIDSENTNFEQNTPLIVKEHSIKVDKVNLLFKELSDRVNRYLTHKFPDKVLDIISSLQFTI